MTADNNTTSAPEIPKSQAQEQPKQRVFYEPEQDITAAFKDGVSLQVNSSPDILLNYVNTCGNLLFVGSRGPHVPISEAEYEVKKYYSEKCIEIVFNGKCAFNAPEPIMVDPPTEAKNTDEEKKEAEEKPEPVVSFADFRPKVMKTVIPEEITVGVPKEYQPSEDPTLAPVPVINSDATQSNGPEGQQGKITVVVKKVSDLTDQDRLFMKNRYLGSMHGLYRNFVEKSARFDAMCHRSKELLRKMTTRRARRMFSTSINKSEDGTTLELIPNPKGNNDLKNINMWYMEFCRIFQERGMLLKHIIDIVAESKKLQETPMWTEVVGEPVFDWKQRIERYMLSEGNEELLSFVQNQQLPSRESEEVETDPIKDAVMFHFFNVSPKVIIQLAIAKPTKDGLFADDSLQQSVEGVVE